LNSFSGLAKRSPVAGNEHDSGPHAGSPSFVLADPTRLGFLVFSKPIATPKLNLGPFPKVSAPPLHTIPY